MSTTLLTTMESSAAVTPASSMVAITSDYQTESQVSYDTYVYDYAAGNCSYSGTDFLDVKIYLIGVFGTSMAICNMIFNSFYTIVFITNRQLRSSPLYYFGILAILDILLACNYILLMSVPVYFDYFNQLWLYHLFLSYLMPIMTLSNTAMFASMLLLFMATLERLLRTVSSENLTIFRKILQRNRPQVSALVIAVAFMYKLCTYFEMTYIERDDCTDWSRYEVSLSPLGQIPDYNFYWMFLTRNLLDRIIPFCMLVFINFVIIRTLKREHQRFSVLEPSIMYNTDEVSKKKMLRDATRALIAVVSLYLMSQTLQVFITFWETIHRPSLEENFTELYSYLNDIMSLMTLLSSTLRFPVYFICNHEIHIASQETMRRLRQLLFADSKLPSTTYTPVDLDPSGTTVVVYANVDEKRMLTDGDGPEWQL